MIIAIDGPAGSGKSTTARLVAQRLGYLYLDTGAMYRAVALALLRAGDGPTLEAATVVLPRLHLDVAHEGGQMRMLLDGADVSEAIRAPEVSALVSQVSAFAPVRDKLVDAQRRIAQRFLAQGGGAVLDGRDIGTVVFPDADVKVYMVAGVEERAARRQAELAAEGRDVPLDEVLRALQQRDALDSTRALAPLRKADDAFELDTTRRSIQEQVQFVIDKVRERHDGSAV